MSEHLQTAPGVPGLLGASVVARLPLAMFSIALLVHTRALTGSFATAGAVTGAYAAAQGVGGPLLGRAADRRGQTLPLLAAATVAAAVLAVLALLPHGAAPALILALAALLGLATPPVGACARSLLPELLRDPGALRAAYAFEPSAIGLPFIFAPPLALGLGALWSTGAALGCGGAILLAATAAFALQPASRAARASTGVAPSRAGSLCSPGMRTLALVLTAAGVLFGAVEVGVTAAASTLGGNAVAAPLLALWGGGSLVGGVIASRLGGGAQSARGLALVLLALAAGHLALVGAQGSAAALGAVIFVAGAAIAPAYATVYGMVDAVAPAGTVTEAFAWLSTAVAVGAAAGAAPGGALAHGTGPGAAFLLAGIAGGFAVAAAVIRAGTLPGARPALATAQPKISVSPTHGV